MEIINEYICKKFADVEIKGLRIQINPLNMTPNRRIPFLRNLKKILCSCSKNAKHLANYDIASINSDKDTTQIRLNAHENKPLILSKPLYHVSNMGCLDELNSYDISGDGTLYGEYRIYVTDNVDYIRQDQYLKNRKHVYLIENWKDIIVSKDCEFDNHSYYINSDTEFKIKVRQIC